VTAALKLARRAKPQTSAMSRTAMSGAISNRWARSRRRLPTLRHGLNPVA
jgi:hypothetical protein